MTLLCACLLCACWLLCSIVYVVSFPLIPSTLQPTTVATYGAAALAVVVAVINYHTTLQFIGVAGTLGIAINWFTSFDTPEVGS